MCTIHFVCRCGDELFSASFIPEGSSATVHLYSLGRDPRYFSPMPNYFLPDRWLSAEQRDLVGSPLKSGDIVLNMNAFIPFSFGPANCVGKSLAMIELRMVICTLMQRFEMRFVKAWDPAQYGRDLRDNLVLRKGELPVLLTSRKAN